MYISSYVSNIQKKPRYTSLLAFVFAAPICSNFLQVMLLVIALAYIAERIAPPKVERKDSAESAGHKPGLGFQNSIHFSMTSQKSFQLNKIE